jgi:hypothetical protein
MLRQDRPDLARRYWKGMLWSPSYFAASCGGAPRNILKNYIEQQKKPRRRLLGALYPQPEVRGFTAPPVSDAR